LSCVLVTFGCAFDVSNSIAFYTFSAFDVGIFIIEEAADSIGINTAKQSV
jgi:hypothetical protein